MVSDFIMGAIIGGVFTLLGSLGAAVVDIYKTKNIQQNEDKRIIAQKLAEEDAELLTELNFQLNKCHRVYTEGVHRAATHTLSEEKYNKDHKQEFRKLQEIVERSSLFLND